MTEQPRFLFTASMDVSPTKRELFDEVYDTEHIPLIASVPGVVSVVRYRRRELTIVLGGKRQTIVSEGEPSSTVVYGIEHPDVLVSESWAQRVDQGRWPRDVRPFTVNRRLVLLERVGS